ncbi:hypothetical protein DL98DRAFT_107635 [Cadophora sp. DSE1049]|nr:hypothetical protein DL98DRAFT_107635 [Cadophora sp. DSE1049]
MRMSIYLPIQLTHSLTHLSPIHPSFLPSYRTLTRFLLLLLLLSPTLTSQRSNSLGLSRHPHIRPHLITRIRGGGKKLIIGLVGSNISKKNDLIKMSYHIMNFFYPTINPPLISKRKKERKTPNVTP